METNQTEAPDENLPGSNNAATQTIDEFEIYFNLYGSLSVVFATGFPLLWRFLLKDT